MRGEFQNTERHSRMYLKGGAAERNRNTMLLMPRSKIKRAGVVNRGDGLKIRQISKRKTKELLLKLERLSDLLFYSHQLGQC